MRYLGVRYLDLPLYLQKKNLGKRNLNLELFLCDREPCLNGGKCVADTDKSTTTCVCSSIYDGDKCECKSN